MRSGHYVAYVKDLPDPSATTSGMVDAALPGRPRWWYVSDTRVREVSSLATPSLRFRLHVFPVSTSNCSFAWQRSPNKRS